MPMFYFTERSDAGRNDFMGAVGIIQQINVFR